SGFVEDISLEVNRVTREHLGGAEPSPVGVKRLQHGDDETGRRTKPSARRQVSHVMKFGPFVAPAFLKTRTYRWMIHFRGVARIFGLAICDAKAMIEKLVVKPLDGDVREPINCRCEYSATVPFEVLREVAAASQKADADGRLRDD